MPISTPRTAPEAFAQALRLERAWQIIREGYSFWPDAETGTVAVVKPGFLHTAYWLEDHGTSCDCRDFRKTNRACKHIIAYALVASHSIPTLAHANLETVREFCRQRDMQAEETECDHRARQIEEQEFGRLVMVERHTVSEFERNLLCC